MFFDNSPLREYQVLTVERRGGARSVRALIAGPGAPAGVWYPVASARAAHTLASDLNLALFYARQVKASGSRRTAKAGC